MTGVYSDHLADREQCETGGDHHQSVQCVQCVQWPPVYTHIHQSDTSLTPDTPPDTHILTCQWTNITRVQHWVILWWYLIKWDSNVISPLTKVYLAPETVLLLTGSDHNQAPVTAGAEFPRFEKYRNFDQVQWLMIRVRLWMSDSLQYLLQFEREIIVDGKSLYLRKLWSLTSCCWTTLLWELEK